MDGYLLENGTDRLLLEDGTGIYLLEQQASAGWGALISTERNSLVQGNAN